MQTKTTSPMLKKVAALEPMKIASSGNQRHIQAIIEDSQTAIITLGSALQAVLTEVSDGSTPYSADSYLPKHLIEIIRSALGLPPEIAK